MFIASGALGLVTITCLERPLFLHSTIKVQGSQTFREKEVSLLTCRCYYNLRLLQIATRTLCSTFLSLKNWKSK